MNLFTAMLATLALLSSSSTDAQTLAITRDGSGAFPQPGAGHN